MQASCLWLHAHLTVHFTSVVDVRIEHSLSVLLRSAAVVSWVSHTMLHERKGHSELPA